MSTRPMLDLHKVFDLDPLTDDEFKLVVDADLRRHSTTERNQMPDRLAEELRTPKYVERWLSTLLRMEANIESQLEVGAADFEANLAVLRTKALQLGQAGDHAFGSEVAIEIESLRTEHQRKRASILRFKGGLDKTIIEARQILNTVLPFETAATAERDHYKGRFRQLRTAIATHQSLTIQNEIPANDIDKALWASIT